MPRPLRLHVPGGFYHVTLRGNHRQAIFLMPGDQILLEGIVADALARLGARLHAYCWMTNHVHMLMQVSDAPLGKILRLIASRYARIVQKRLETTGHLFERRFHAVLVDEERYLMTLMRYIHLNPVRAALVADPVDYPWSSHREYLGLREQPWLTTSFALRLLAIQPDAARVAYRNLFAEPSELRWGAAPLQPHPDNTQILGDDGFAARVTRNVTRSSEASSLDALIRESSQKFEVPPDAIFSRDKRRMVCAARAWLAKEALHRGVTTMAELARKLGCSDTAIRRLVNRHAKAD